MLAALKRSRRAVLQAPPGAGKTTRVPLALLEAGLVEGRILMLEPRRLAARAAAERMAQTLGEKVGVTVGYRMRGEAKVSSATRIEVVTEGILTRMIQSDPSLEGIGAVILDEFHERSLNADLGLALVWEVCGALREDLVVLVMSATLDAEPVAALLDDAPVVTSQGRSFPVEMRFLERPLAKGMRFEAAVTSLIEQALNETEGGVLIFLPGEGEIRRVQAGLRVPKGSAVHPLFGAMDFKAQRAAIAPSQIERKVVLATAIAETSLTIPDIRVVIDGGKARRARFDPNSGMSRLVTERVTKAEAVQRAGRAGRVAEGVCYKLWTKGEDGGLLAFPPAEIEAADLTGLVLELALWGAAPGDLAFLTVPPDGAYSEAQALLQMLGALDAAGRITKHGRALAKLPLHPRLGHMLTVAGKDAAVLAALLADRDPLRSRSSDLMARLKAVRSPPADANRGVIERVRSEARRLEKLAPDSAGLEVSEMAALAYPDRIGLRRKGEAPRYLLSGGKGAFLDDADPLAGQRLIVATDLDGDAREARVRQAVPISESAVRGLFGPRLTVEKHCHWSKREHRVVARVHEKLGAIALSDQLWKDASPEEIAEAMLDGVRDLGLIWSDAARRFRARVALLEDLPDMSEAALLECLEDWLLPHLDGVKTEAQWKAFDTLPALRAMLDWDQTQRLDKAAPAAFVTPLGRKVPIDYRGEAPEISVRLQEMFGVTAHPMVGRTPLRVTLLSPARRPLQTTMDIPGFWASSYADVRKDMRGRYPRHPWPEDPTQADPTLRAKRRT